MLLTALPILKVYSPNYNYLKLYYSFRLYIKKSIKKFQKTISFKKSKHKKCGNIY